MVECIRIGVEEVFKGAPHTKKVQELKEELTGNLEARYEDLIAEGKDSEEAYKMVMGSIGDIDELIATVVDQDPLNLERVQKEREKTAKVVVSAIALYILSVIAVIFIEEYGGRYLEPLGIGVFFMFSGAATCLLVYHFLSRPNYVKAEASIVEEFKEWKQASSQKKQIYDSITSIMWSLIIVIYFGASFILGIWSYSWIIFIMGVAIQRIIKLVFDLYEMR